MSRPEEAQRQQERYTDNLLQSSFSYWSAILTVNGLILAFFSSDIITVSYKLDFLVVILLFLTVISIILILFNYRAIRDLYFDLGSVTFEEFKKMSEEERKEAFENAPSGFKWRRFRETSIEILMAVEILLILFLVVYSKYFQC